MRVKCKCGKIAGCWYSPMTYVRMRVDQYLNAHCYCASCADTENWAEYEYIGFHKRDWQWLKMKRLTEIIIRDAWMDKPYYMVSYIKEGKRWYYGIVRERVELEELEKMLEGMEWKEEWYPDIRKNS